MGYGTDSIMLNDTLYLKQLFNWDIFVETGTDRGETIRVVRPYFSKIYSCEIEPERWDYYHDLLDDDNIIIKNGPSVEYLPQFFEEIGHDRFFLFLDAHWGGNWPILDELALVAQWGYKPVIIIHDFDNGLGFAFDRFRPEENNPTGIEYLMNFDYVKESIEKVYGVDGYIFRTNTECNNTHKVGCAYFYPKL